MSRRKATTVLAAALAIALLAAAPAAASFGFDDLALEISGSQAGIHPAEVATTLAMESILNEDETLEVPDGRVEDLEVDMPEGFAGNPTAVPTCPMELFLEPADNEGHTSCPNATAIGYAAVRAAFEPVPPDAPGYLHVAVYNLAPPPGKAAKIGFTVLSVPVTIEVGLREAPPYAVYARVSNIAQATYFYASKLTLWGNPAAAANDALRGTCLALGLEGPADEVISKGKCPVDIVETPFLTAPRSCEGPLIASFFALAWNTGEEATGTASAPGRGGCSKLGFAPQAAAQMSSQRAESPSGLSFNLEIADEGLTSPKDEATAFSDIKSTEVVLPVGVTLNPSQAEGLSVCTEAQLAKETAASPFGAGCPAAAKIGAVEVETPLLEERVLKGSLFIAKPHENPFDSLLALYMVIKDPELGIAVKLPAKVAPDPLTGQIRTTFGDPSAKVPGYRALPQLPLGEVRVNLREGARSPLVTPPACGSYQTKAIFTPWANPDTPYETASSFQIGTGPDGGACPPAGAPPFEPGFEAGALSNNAGSHSPFLMRLSRRDGDQDLTRFSATLPPGVSAKLAGVSQCPQVSIDAAKAKSGRAEQSQPSCPASSRIGAVFAGAGVGQALTYVPGSLYLAGPYHGAPLSVASIVPAVAGPFDVGTVITQVALRVDPRSAQVEVDGAASDPIPHILAGIPLKVREIGVEVDRPEFTLNPTSCDPFAVNASIWGGGIDVFSSADDSPAARSVRFQAANCGALGFKPALSLRLKGGTKRGGHPALAGTYTPRPGDANLAGLVLRLPRSAFLDQAHIRTICTRVQFAAGAGNGAGCPAGAIYGHITASTPILAEPLEGPVFLRSSDHNLPDLVAALHGLVDVEASARIDSLRGGIRATFANLPDAPLTKVVVRMQGAKKGLIVNSTDLCAGVHRANAAFSGQNGKLSRARPGVRAACGKKRRGRAGR